MIEHNKQGCFFRQLSPNKLSPSKQELQGLVQGKCYIKGYLTNEQAVCEQLKIKNGDQQALLNAALEHWGFEVNKHLIGDYVLIWLNGEQLLVTSSARSSFTLFYQQISDKQESDKQESDKQKSNQEKNDQQNNGLTLSTDLNSLSHEFEATINKAQLLQTLALGPLAGKNTCFDHINQLQCGETLIWQLQQNIELSHQARLSHAKQLILAQQNELPTAETIVPRVLEEIDLTKLFNQLPSLAHHLGEPIIDVALAHFDSLVQASETDTLLLDGSWIAARNVIGEQPFKNNHRWCKSILKRPLLQQRSQLNKRHNQLVIEFEAEQNEHHKPLSFSQWLDLHYVIPAWCQILQRICQHHGKTLINPYIGGEKIITMVTQPNNKPAAYFTLQQISLANIYDAMQRLFHVGEPDTLKLFNLNPASTARLVSRQTDNPHRIEQLSVLLLTFDYLARFHPGHFHPSQKD